MNTNGTTDSTAMVTSVDRPTLAKASVEATRTFEPRDAEEAFLTAVRLVKSGLLPRSVPTPEAALVMIMTGRELGLTMMQSLRSIHVIEGKPSLSADLIAALVKNRSEVCEWFRLVESSDKVATYETKRRGEPGPTKMSFSIEDAQRAGVATKDNWKRYPAAMLRARCITALARAVYPDLAMGLYDPDELAPAPEPMHVRTEAYEVVQSARPAATPPAPSRSFEDLCDRVDASETTAAVNVVAKDAAKAHKAGLLTDAQLDRIKTAVTTKRGLFGKPPPEPPSSTPTLADSSTFFEPTATREPGEDG